MIKKHIKKHDFFSKSIDLNIKGETEISTLIGGICTITIYVMILILVGLEFKKLVLNEGDSINSVVKMVDSENIPAVNFNDTDFMFTMSINAEGYEGLSLQDLSKYIDIHLVNERFNGEDDSPDVDVGFKLCDENDFKS